MTKATGSTKALPKNFKKVKSGYDQAFTLPKGTSAAPIKQATKYKLKTKKGFEKLGKAQAYLVGTAVGILAEKASVSHKSKKKNKFFGHTNHINKKRK